MRILVADDDPIMRMRLRKILQDQQHDVIDVEDGQQAIEQLGERAFDCLITDWMMPHKDGPQVITALRNQSEEQYTYAIMLTALGDSDARSKGMDAGADDFLTKPLDKQELLVRLRVAERIISLQRDLAERNNDLNLAKRRLDQDLEAAARVQRDLLPPHPFSLAGAAVDWRLESCDALGGDLIRLLPLSNDRLAFAVVDVAGHGAKAAMLGVQLCRHLSVQGSAGGVGIDESMLLDPEQLARMLNDDYQLDTRTMQYFTMCYGVLDLKTGHCRYVGCGHPPPVLRQANGQTKALETDGNPIGMLPGDFAHFTVLETQLSAGDLLVLYSDGLTECMNDNKEMFGTERLVHAIAQGQQVDGVINSIFTATSAWIGTKEFDDDRSVLCVGITG